MSHIAWHSPSAPTAYLAGWERAHMGAVVSDIAASFLPFHTDPLLARLNPAHSLARNPGTGVTAAQRIARGEGRPLVADVKLYMRHDLDTEPPVFTDHDGTPLRSFDLMLNTVLAVGSDPLCLMTRLDGQCELHAYVEGPNRAWLADLIAAGRATGLYREGAGWEALAELLRSRDDEPLVTSYSAADSWLGVPPSWEPPHHVDPEDAADAWWALPDDERWRLALADLRGRPDAQMELRPGNLRGLFGHERTLLDLFVVSPAVNRKVAT